MVIRVQFLYATLLVATCCASTLAYAEEPAKQQPMPAGGPLSETQRNELLAEVNRLFVETQRFENEGKLKEAIAAGERVLAIQRRLFGEMPDGAAGWDRAMGVEWIAERRERLEDYAGGKLAREEALAIKRKLLGNEHWQVTDARLAVERVVILAGLTADERRDLREANELATEVSRLHSEGSYVKAMPLAEKVIAVRRSLLGEDHHEFARAISWLGFLHKYAGDYARAEPLYRRALEIRRKSMGAAHPDHATDLNNLAELCRAMGDYKRAEQLYLQASIIDKAALGEAHSDYAGDLNNLAALYYSMGDDARAEPLYRQASEIWGLLDGGQHPHYAESLNNLAILYQSMGDSARAEPLYRQALEIKQKALGTAHPRYASSLSNLAALYAAMREDSSAELLFSQAVEIKKQALGETHPEYAVCQQNLAELYRTMGDYARAEPLYRQALAISRKNLDLAAVVQSGRQQLAMLANTRHQLDALVSMAGQAPGYLGGAFDEVLVFKGLVLGRQRAMRAAAEKPEAASILEELRVTASRLATLSFGMPSPQQAKAWKEQIVAISSKKEELEQRLAAASKEYRDAIKPVTLVELRSSLPEGGALVDFLQFWHSSPKSKEQGGGQQWEERLAVFVVRREGDIQFVDLGEAKAVNAAIETWRTGHGDSPEARQAALALREKVWVPIERYLDGVTTVLICPDQELGKLPFAALPGKAPETYLIQERTLAVVPAPQAVVWLQEGAGAKESVESLLVVGGIEYDRKARSEVAQLTQLADRGLAPRGERDAGGAFQPLPGAQDEMNAVGNLYRTLQPGSVATIIEGVKASQEAVAGAAAKHRYLHLATHGYFAAERFKSAMDRELNEVKAGGMSFVSQQSISGYHPGLLSGLALAGANEPTDEDDGILTAAEVESLSLRNVDLVVLSACETGLGKTAGGEGLLGLQRSFQVAGARTVVASLWSVPDEATKTLMVRFYENLWKKKMGKLEALREAQLWMLNHGAEQPGIRRELEARGLTRIGPGAGSGDPRTTGVPPYYWGAWVLSGDWR